MKQIVNFGGSAFTWLFITIAAYTTFLLTFSYLYEVVANLVHTLLYSLLQAESYATYVSRY